MKSMRNLNKSYLELIQLESFEERLEYLMLYGKVGMQTFGDSRYLNQALYKSPEWKEFKRSIIRRDKGCDLGIDGLTIDKYATVHHINPIDEEDILNRAPCVFDRNNVILVSDKTHRIIHYSPKVDKMLYEFADRRPNDTKLW